MRRLRKHALGAVWFLLSIAVGASSAAAATADLTSGATGTNVPSQTFNETRGVAVTVLGTTDRALSAIALHGLSITTATGSVGARV